MMMSINDSPLGVGFAEEDDDDDEENYDADGNEEKEIEEEEADQWDLMDRNEASREVTKMKGRLVKPPPPSSTSSSTQPHSKPARQSSRSTRPVSPSIAKTSAFIPPSSQFTFTSTMQLQQLGKQLENPELMTEGERANAQAQLRKLLALI